MTRRRRNDRGAVTGQVAVIPAVLALFLAVVQLSLWFYGRSVASTAARHGVDAVRVESGSSGDGVATASEFLDQVGGVRSPGVDAARTATDAEVTVRGDAVTVLPFFDVPIDVTIEAPVERVIE